MAAYLQQLDLSEFDAKAPPPKTDAFWDIVNAARAPEEAELADVLDALGNPAAVTLDQIVTVARVRQAGLAEWLEDRKNRRQVPHRLEGAGYEAVRNAADKRDGQWVISGKRQRVYARRDLSLRDRIAAAEALMR